MSQRLHTRERRARDRCSESDQKRTNEQRRSAEVASSALRSPEIAAYNHRMPAVDDQAVPAEPLSVQADVADAVMHLASVYRDYPGLRALILRHVGNPDSAADILQDAAVTTLEKLRSGQITRPENVGGYLYRVAINHLRNYRRKERTAVAASAGLDEVQNMGSDPEWEHVALPQWTAAARRILEEMSVARDREVLLQFYLHDREKSQICHELQLSEEHFNRVIFRARNRFRELLQRHGLRKADFLTLCAITLCIASGIGGVAGTPVL